MHNFLINASIQILPVATEKHPYEWVDEAIEIIRKSGLQYEVNAFATTIEGMYNEVMKVIGDINEHLNNRGCEEWITNLQIQIRSTKDITAGEKTMKHRQQ